MNSKWAHNGSSRRKERKTKNSPLRMRQPIRSLLRLNELRAKSLRGFLRSTFKVRPSFAQLFFLQLRLSTNSSKICFRVRRPLSCCFVFYAVSCFFFCSRIKHRFYSHLLRAKKKWGLSVCAVYMSYACLSCDSRVVVCGCPFSFLTPGKYSTL